MESFISFIFGPRERRKHCGHFFQWASGHLRDLSGVDQESVEKGQILCFLVLQEVERHRQLKVMGYGERMNHSSSFFDSKPLIRPQPFVIPRILGHGELSELKGIGGFTRVKIGSRKSSVPRTLLHCVVQFIQESVAVIDVPLERRLIR